MTHTIRTATIAGALALVAALAVPALMAQGGSPPGAPMGRGMGPGGRGAGGPAMGQPLGALDLTDAQREQVKSIRDSHQAEFTQVSEKLRAARESLRALANADAFDEAAVRAKAAELGAAEADQAVLGAKVRSEIFSILTAEQQQKMKDLQAERRNRGSQQTRPRRQGRPPQNL